MTQNAHHGKKKKYKPAKPARPKKKKGAAKPSSRRKSK
jgi:hypothetical protein